MKMIGPEAASSRNAVTPSTPSTRGSRSDSSMSNRSIDSEQARTSTSPISFASARSRATAPDRQRRVVGRRPLPRGLPRAPDRGRGRCGPPGTRPRPSTGGRDGPDDRSRPPRPSGPRLPGACHRFRRRSPGSGARPRSSPRSGSSIASRRDPRQCLPAGIQGATWHPVGTSAHGIGARRPPRAGGPHVRLAPRIGTFRRRSSRGWFGRSSGTAWRLPRRDRRPVHQPAPERVRVRHRPDPSPARRR